MIGHVRQQCFFPPWQGASSRAVEWGSPILIFLNFTKIQQQFISVLAANICLLKLDLRFDFLPKMEKLQQEVKKSGLSFR